MQHRLICPHTHHQDGVVERKHWHIVETALIVMSQASMSFEFWDHAVISAVYLINRLPSSSIHQEVPYQRLFKRLPDYKFLKVFGCALLSPTKAIQSAQTSAKGIKSVSFGVTYDYNVTFSPVIKSVTVRILLSLAVTHKWSLQQLDVNNAFLNGILEENIYMSQPPGFENSNKQLVCKLNKAIYGLKHAPRAWFDMLKATLLRFHFRSSKCDPLFVYTDSKNTVIYMLVYVDDIIVTGTTHPSSNP